MAKRKFGMSLIVLIVAATTMVSGTYAWFLVGGFAELFDLGFDVVEATGGGFQIQGSAGKAYKNKDDLTDIGWGYYLDRACFNDGEILAADTGKYRPVSSVGGTNFIKVGLDSGYFTAAGDSSKGIPGTDYNEIKMKIRSETQDPVDANIKVTVSDTKASGTESSNVIKAARVSVTYNGTTTIYAMDGDSANGVASGATFSNIFDKNANDILDAEDVPSPSSYLTAQQLTSYTAGENANEYVATQALAGVSNAGADVIVRIWVEGNDADCRNNAFSEGRLNVKINFGATEETTNP